MFSFEIGFLYHFSRLFFGATKKNLAASPSWRIPIPTRRRIAKRPSFGRGNLGLPGDTRGSDVKHGGAFNGEGGRKNGVKHGVFNGGGDLRRGEG